MRRFLRKKEVLERTGLSNSALYRKIAAGEIAAPISLGGRSVAWLESSIEDFIQSRIDAAQNHHPAERSAARAAELVAQ